MLILKITTGVILVLAIWHLVLTYKTQLIQAAELTWHAKYLRNGAKAVAVILPTLWILAILINWKFSGDRETESAHAANLRKIAATEACRTLSATDLAKLFQPTGSSFTSALDECVFYESLEPYSGSKSLQERLQEIEENEIFVRLEWLSKELEAQKQLEIEREANVPVVPKGTHPFRR
jgi:hypothetical protein